MNRKLTVTVLFFSYLIILVAVLFLRKPDGLGNSIDAIRYRFQDSVNLVPFHTLDSYKSAYLAGNMSTSTYYLNIYGNAVLFLPMGLILPCMFKEKLPFFRSLLTIICIIVSFELLQLIFGVGRADIDDVILNFLGALAGRLLIIQKIRL